jgi:hypothetical protein
MPSGGDPRTAASVDLPMSELADLILFGWNGQSITPPAFGGGQSNNYAPTDWSWATLVRVSSSTAHSIGGFDANAAVKRKTIVNVGANGISLLHLAGSQTAGNQIITPSAVTHLLGPGDTAIIEYDTTAAAWRVVGGRSLAANHAWTGAHSWGSSFAIFGGTLSGSGAIDVDGTIEGSRFVVDHASAEFEYKVARTRTLQLPLNFNPEDASDSDVVWSAISSGGVASINSGKGALWLTLPTAAVLTGVFAGVTPGGASMVLTARREILNGLTGDIAVSSIGSADTTSGPGYQVLDVGAVSFPVDNAAQRFVVTLQASAVLQQCAGIWVTFNDYGPRSY